MLELTLATQFVPGTNLRGEVAGANWMFLLPALDLERVICWGVPPSRTLTMLAAAGRRVTICASSRQLEDSNRRRDLPNVDWIAVNDGDYPLPFEDSSTDLLLVIGKQRVQQFIRDGAIQAEIHRILKSEGSVYFELRSRPGRLKSLNNLIEPLRTRQCFWLTPLSGEMYAAVPLDDRKTKRYFLDRNLYSASLTMHTFKHAKRLIAGRSVTEEVAPKQSSAENAPSMSARRSRYRLRSIVRKLGNGFLRTANSAERFLYRHTGLPIRCGVLIRLSEDNTDGRTPAYIRRIAQEVGSDLDGYRWGLWAGGEYSSRKVLLFLFDQTSNTPEYLVKMVRNSTFNRRLENEYQALKLLNEMQVGDSEILPQVVFFGHHNNLAMLGETIINGVPFRERTEWTVNCPYLHAAIDWLGDLAAKTAQPSISTSAQVADVLETLFTRFNAIYHLTDAQHNFLGNQIAVLRNRHESFPLVFQHGDPGPWNMLVTPTERVALLDWESAEAQGMPLWDLFYFFRSYLNGVAQINGTHDRLQSFEEYFLAASPLTSLVVDTTRRYAESIGLSQAFIEPIFYTCWMHRALKQSTLLESSGLERGYYVNLLRLCIDQREAHTLKLLFGDAPRI